MKTEFSILVVEDDDNDYLLLERAFRKKNLGDRLHRVRDGVEAIEYLRGEGLFADAATYPFPDLLIVDLKMPRMSGLELLAWIREHPEHRVIPTLIMSSSEQGTDVAKAYDLGANTYFVKPSDFQALLDLVQSIDDYWLRGVRPGTSGNWRVK